MTRLPGARAARDVARWVTRRLHRPAEDGGFILLESLIAITVITIVMSAVGAEFLGGMVASSQQRAQQVAVQLADSTLEQIQSLDPSDLVTGRDASSVGAQFDKGVAIPAVRPGLCGRPTTTPTCDALMDNASDPAATSGSGISAAVPTCGDTADPVVCQRTPGAVPYTVNQYLGWCSILKTAAVPSPPASADCIRSSTSSLTVANSTKYLRAVVAVSWNGPRCVTTCAYVTSTLLSAAADPTFRINAGAYAAPVVLAQPTQTSVVGDTNVNLTMSVQNGTGVPPFTWSVSAGALPSGLVLNPSTGVVSTSPPGPTGGAVQGPAGTYTSTIKATDAFVRSDTQVVTWVVKPALVLTPPGQQSAAVNQATSLALGATGGDGPPYTFSVLSGLPPGLGLSPSTGVIAGTPTTAGVYSVQVKVVDKTNTRSDVATFTWSVGYAPVTATTPPAQVSTLGTPVQTVQLNATGGDGRYVWADPTGSLPAGLSISQGGLVSGTPTVLTSSSGKPVTLTVSDPTAGTPYTTTVSFTWRVVVGPTVAAPFTSTVLTIGQSITLSLATGCPNAPCTYALNNGPTGLTVTNAGVVTGTVAGTATTFSNVTITVTDSAGATGSTGVFAVVVKGKPAVSGSPQTDTAGSYVSVPLTTTCPNSPCSYSLSNGPANLSVSAAGVVTGTVGGTAQVYSNVTVTVTDSVGVSVTSATFAWTVKAPPTVSGTAQTTTLGDSVSYPLATTCPNSPCRYVLNNGPTGLSVSPDGVITGTIGGTTQSYPAVTVTVTDADGVSLTSAAFTWTVKTKATVSGSAQTNTLGQAVNVQLTTTCPYAPCSYALNDGPTNLSVTSAGVVTGTIGGTPQTYTNPTVTVTDAGGFSVTSPAFSWTVFAKPRLSGVAAQNIGQTATPTFSIPYDCPAAPCTIALSGTLTTTSVGLGLSTSVVSPTANGTRSLTAPSGGGTVYLTGLVSSSAVPSGAVQSPYGVSLSITDANGFSPPASSATYTAYSTPTVSSPGPLTTSPTTRPTPALRLPSPCVSTCAYTVTGQPPGIGLYIQGNSLYLGGTVDSTATRTTYLVTVTATDPVSGVSVTSSGIWTVQ
jgi:type II secretory pathway pseudopilin PulG